METTNNSALGDCLRDFQTTFNGNEQVKKLIKGWNRSLVLEATDTAAGLTVIVSDLMVTEINEGARAEDDDETIHLQASEDTLVRIFSGDYNPANALIDGELAVFSSEKDKVKLEAISIVIWGM